MTTARIHGKHNSKLIKVSKQSKRDTACLLTLSACKCAFSSLSSRIEDTVEWEVVSTDAIIGKEDSLFVL